MVIPTDNPDRDLERHERQQEEWIKSRPVCYQCEEPIQEEFMFEYENEIFCPNCWDVFVTSNFLKEIE